MIDRIPNVLFRLNPGNYEEICKKCPRTVSALSPSSTTPWTSIYQTQWFYEEVGVSPDVPDLIRRLAKKHGFSNFKWGLHAGSCLNVANGVSVFWRIGQYTSGEERGCVFEKVGFTVRKARTLTGYNSGQYQYQETSYVEDKASFCFDSFVPLHSTIVDHDKTLYGDADEMFREAFKYAEGLQGDPAITKNSLKKQVLQNMILSSIFDKIKKDVFFNVDGRIVRFASDLHPAKAPEDTCVVEVSLVPDDSRAADSESSTTQLRFVHWPAIKTHPSLMFWLSQKSFKFADNNSSDCVFDRSIDFSDPSFDVDKLYLWIKDVLVQYFNTALEVAELKHQIISLSDRATNLSVADSKLFERTFNANFGGVSTWFRPVTDADYATPTQS